MIRRDDHVNGWCSALRNERRRDSGALPEPSAGVLLPFN